MKNLPVFLLLVLFASSCSHSYYASNMHNVPVFAGKNELSVAGALSSGFEVTGGEAQMSYSVTDNIGVTADYMHAVSGDTEEKDFSKENYFAAGLGYYETVSDVVSFGLYGGVGTSTQYHEYSSENYNGSTGSSSNEYLGYADIGYMKYYVQPQFGFRHKYVQMAVSTRVSMLDYNRVEDHSSSAWDNFDELRTQNHLYIEPAFTVRVGGDVLKFQFQALMSARISNDDDYDYHDFCHFSLGAHFTIPTGRVNSGK